MLTDLWLVCRFTWWQTSRDDFKQVFSLLEGEHHWAGRICKLCSAASDLISQQLLNLAVQRAEDENSVEALPACFEASHFWIIAALGERCMDLFPIKKKNSEAICLKAAVCISIYTHRVTFLFFNPLLHFQVILSKLFLVSLVLDPFLISGGHLS